MIFFAAVTLAFFNSGNFLLSEASPLQTRGDLEFWPSLLLG